MCVYIWEIYELQTVDSDTHKKQDHQSIREILLCRHWFYSRLLSGGMQDQPIYSLYLKRRQVRGKHRRRGCSLEEESCRTCSEHQDFFVLEVDCWIRRREKGLASRETKAVQINFNQQMFNNERTHGWRTHSLNGCSFPGTPYVWSSGRARLRAQQHPRDTSRLSQGTCQSTATGTQTARSPAGRWLTGLEAQLAQTYNQWEMALLPFVFHSETR